jgi:hypothetical protein
VKLTYARQFTNRDYYLTLRHQADYLHSAVDVVCYITIKEETQMKDEEMKRLKKLKQKEEKEKKKSKNPNKNPKKEKRLGGRGC